MAGVKAFREAYLSADLQDADDFTDFDARRLRYAVLWAFFENSAYRDLHTWAKKLRADYGLYKYARNIYNPAFRLGEFWQAHLLGGALDPEVGDGKQTPSALPILTDHDRLRSAIGQLWRDSNWPMRKDLLTLHGAILGDAVIKVIDDTRREKVYLDLVHPGTLADATLDPFGNVKGYEIREERADPRGANRTVTYRETAERDGDSVVYRTYLNNDLYAWNGDVAEWDEPYGFVPMVVVQHVNVGLAWGWSELHAGLPKFREADDLASKLSDHVRKYVDPAWLFAGIQKAATTPTVPGTESSTTRPEPGREEVPAIYTNNPDAKAQPLVAPLSIADTVTHIKGILEEIERDYPELQTDIWQASGGDVSGRALRVARQRTESKAEQRRAPYDDALKRAQQMAVAIGGFRGYEGYAGFNLDSYARGDLEHSIGQRPVFAQDPAETLEMDKLFWEVANQAKTAGLPLEIFLRRKGWSEEEIAEVKNSPEFQAMTFGAYP